MRRANWKNIGHLIERAIGRPEMSRTLRAQRVMRQWASCVGEPIAKKSHPEKFQKGTLWVGVSSAAWVQELQMLKLEILQRLNTLAEEDLFSDIRFAVKQVSSFDNSHPVEKPAFIPMEIDIVVNNPELKEIAQRALGRMKSAGMKGHPPRVDET